MKKIWFILLSLFVFPIVTFAQENIGEDDSLAFLSTTGYFKTISVYDQNDILVDTATIKITENQYENEVILPSEYGIMRSIGESCINGIFTGRYGGCYGLLRAGATRCSDASEFSLWDRIMVLRTRFVAYRPLSRHNVPHRTAAPCRRRANPRC